MVIETEVRTQLGGVGTDEVSSAVIIQAISQATNEVDARKRSDAPAALVEDAKVKLAAYLTWSAVLKSGRYELDVIKEEGFDVMLNNYKQLAEAAVKFISTPAITISTDYDVET